jgi:hypothetical protein
MCFSSVSERFLPDFLPGDPYQTIPYNIRRRKAHPGSLSDLTATFQGLSLC